ncbi:alpha/beta fold hydrolase [Streptomyces noursei]|uniref:Alpha/beta hydrolase n=1 Tax=Streptomyces noursei TaxID=1971 RepID=A0A401R9U1_STRNR|nr:alpha/beta hydrolase [Streptomyces noursei]AKA06632.1 fluoroacetate dehalogenase [Streptomyces noursei ZPM]EXU92516.1 fluoroacetate dehalogenase [Streptomyces noursei PD-1]UWS75152.1 alpha/beta hydrolase [Streptomyces noursei]GCB94411.1 alpha/beta hydrolase [Streptomyces noursei]
MTNLLPEFSHRTVDAEGVRINVQIAGEGPPLLLLHGYPQTHLIWHQVAPHLAAGHTVVLTDLRGYGDSDKPPSDPDHTTYAKRWMALDQLLVMRELGFDRFAVAGHDRGGRVAHRLALDHPHAVTALAVLDIVPTRHAFQHADADFGLGYYHWYFLAAGNNIPEHLIGADPGFWVRTRMSARHHGGTPFSSVAQDEYVRCFSDPAAIHASCEDYRAAASIDLVHDEADATAGRRVTCPLLALWGEHSFVGRHYDVLDVWRAYATDVRGQALPCDHYVPEEAPEATARLLQAFLRDR